MSTPKNNPAASGPGRKPRIRTTSADYFGSGAFQGGAKGVSVAGIKYGETCVVMSEKAYARITAWMKGAEKHIARLEAIASGELRSDEPGVPVPKRFK